MTTMFEIDIQLFGGRGSSSGGTRGGGRSGSGSAGGGSSQAQPQTFQVQQTPPQIQFSAQAAQQANNGAFKAVDNSPYHDLHSGRQYFQRQNLTPDQQQAVIEYLRNDKEILNGQQTQYSMAQNMNWIMTQNAEKGLPIDHGMNANQRYVLKHMQAAMHNLGYNVNLTRYDHGDFLNRILRKAGIKQDFSNMSESQLKQVLVGMKYGENKLISTTYNDFKNAPQQTKDTFLNRAIRIEYKADAGTQAMMPGDGPGGRSGEVVLNASRGRDNFEILGVRFDSSRKVRQKGTSWLSSQNQLVITVRAR